ncbi:hypothetical protein L6452_14967 [Arctium lappa]|uniref:Uncharacterized protein n=1 Tax=Arctium lappa TaxID=4217 RepID=A0ACB9CMR3_ARCLA|nr:hypothetical protein L6452_14967 [Arctium lappa]
MLQKFCSSFSDYRTSLNFVSLLIFNSVTNREQDFRVEAFRKFRCENKLSGTQHTESTPSSSNQSPPSIRLLPPSPTNITTTPTACSQSISTVTTTPTAWSQSISTVYSPSSSISGEHHHHSIRLQALLLILFASYSLLPSVSCGCGNRVLGYSDGVPDADFDTGDDRGRFLGNNDGKATEGTSMDEVEEGKSKECAVRQMARDDRRQLSKRRQRPSKGRR